MTANKKFQVICTVVLAASLPLVVGSLYERTQKRVDIENQEQIVIKK